MYIAVIVYVSSKFKFTYSSNALALSNSLIILPDEPVKIKSIVPFVTVVLKEILILSPLFPWKEKSDYEVFASLIVLFIFPKTFSYL